MSSKTNKDAFQSSPQNFAYLPLSVRQRLMHIERCLFWKGEVQRADLMETFDVTKVQAARDFRFYMDSFPGNMIYNQTRKRYVAQPGFTTYVIQPKTLDEFTGFTSEYIPVARWPLPLRRAAPEVLLSIVTAVRERKKIEVQYQSMTGKDPEWRWLSPHAFADDSDRWHVRAFCHQRAQFRDFVLGRILATRHVDSTEIDPSEDVEWSQFVELLITPNPQLEHKQRQAIAAEYGIPEDLELTLRVRQSMLFYVNAKFNSTESDSPAARQLFVVQLRGSN